jgi:hypothetical protein
MDPNPSPEADLEGSARVEIERAENADDVTRLRVLDDLYEALEAELDEDNASRS